jgi:uncharacterized protein (DUF1697 family)
VSATHVALLRGINVGGKNMLPMPALVKLFTAAGCTEVATYIQSGNIVFRATAAVAKQVPAAIAAAIVKHHALTVPVVLRTADEVAAVLAGNPFKRAPEKELHVAFLAAAPAAAAIAALDPARSPGDELRVIGKDIYLRLGNGAGKTKLTNAYLDGKLATTSTMRNWNTVRALHALITGDAEA